MRMTNATASDFKRNKQIRLFELGMDTVEVKRVELEDSPSMKRLEDELEKAMAFFADTECIHCGQPSHGEGLCDTCKVKLYF